jgi:hypothetical protein
MYGVGSGTSGTHRTPFRSSDQTQGIDADRGESIVAGPVDAAIVAARGRWSAKGCANVTVAVRGSGPFLLVLLSSSLWAPQPSSLAVAPLSRV